MNRVLKYGKVIFSELLTLGLVTGTYLLSVAEVYGFFYKDIFEAKSGVGISILIVLEIVAMFWIGREVWRSCIGRKKLFFMRFLILSVVVSFFIAISNIAVIRTVTKNSGWEFWAFYISPILVIPFIYLILSLWKCYNWKLSVYLRRTILVLLGIWGIYMLWVIKKFLP